MLRYFAFNSDAPEGNKTRHVEENDFVATIVQCRPRFLKLSASPSASIEWFTLQVASAGAMHWVNGTKMGGRERSRVLPEHLEVFSQTLASAREHPFP